MKNERVNELTGFLEALANAQASGYKCSGEMREVIRELRKECGMLGSYEEEYNRYLSQVFTDCDNHYTKDREIVNAQIFKAYRASYAGELFFKRGTGVSTSILALQKLHEDVEYIQFSRDLGILQDVKDKVVFIESGLSLPRGMRPKCVITIRSIDVVGTKKLPHSDADVANIV